MSWLGQTVGQFFGSWFGSTQDVEQPPAGGTSATGGSGGKRKRRRVVRYSDLEARQELEIAAMAVRAAPLVAPAPVKIEDDEEIITLMLLTA